MRVLARHPNGGSSAKLTAMSKYQSRLQYKFVAPQLTGEGIEDTKKKTGKNSGPLFVYSLCQEENGDLCGGGGDYAGITAQIPFDPPCIEE